MKKLQYWALRIFLTCMITTAALALALVWSKGPDSFGVPNQLMITFFIVGLGSFLVWLVLVILEIRNKILGR